MDSTVIRPNEFHPCMETTISTENLIHATKNSRIEVAEQDRIFIKQLWKYPVPTAEELNTLLTQFKDDDPVKIAFWTMIVTGARPVEVVRLQWNRFVYDPKNKEFARLLHETYKPSNRASKIGRHYYFKQVRKEISSKSKQYSKLLLNYQHTCPKYDSNKLFPFTTPDALDKHLSRLRKKLQKNKDPKLAFLFDTNIVQIKGIDSRRKYRISLYSLRRFAITFLYYSKAPVGFDKDIVALAKYIGHTNPRTTYESYVMPKEAIGLTQDLINKKVTIDEFLQIRAPKQKLLEEYAPKPKFQFIPKGQSVISDFF
jgi:integrase